MAAPTHSVPSPSKLSWKSDGEYQTATADRCLYFRESSGSMIGAAIFCVLIVSSSGWMAVQLLLTGESIGEKACSLLFILLVAVFLYIPWLTFRHGRRMIVFDRGEPGIPGEIRTNDMRLSAELVRGFSTRLAGGGAVPKRMVVAELHDGKVVTVGMVSGSTWPAYYAQKGAIWMGLTFHHPKG